MPHLDPDWDSNDLFRQLCEERALADDLADVLTRTTADYRATTPDVLRVLARYREARGL